VGYFIFNIPSITSRFDKEKIRIVEIGAGVGALSISLAKILEQQEMTKQYEIIMTEIPEELDLLERNVALNSIESEHIALTTDVLYWGCDEDIARIGHADVIIASDVVYEIQHFDILIDTLNRISTQETVFIMAMEHRWKDIEKFWWEDLVGWKWDVVQKKNEHWWEIPEIDVYIMQKISH
jgi:predicted nicotinamide N-methyase